MRDPLRKLTLAVPLLVVAAFATAQVAKVEEKSVRPGINDRFLDANLEVQDFVNRWEVESREVYTQREEILKVCGLKKGMRIADIGSGTGLYTRMFSDAVGEKGWVYAVDISPRFIQHVNAWARDHGKKNVTSVYCLENSVTLPPESIDVAYVCATYHHFEYPMSTNASILRALKKGGTLIVVDFERIPGVTREWVMGHVRAGKPVVKKEILDSGFTFLDEVEVPGLEENYVLRFTKK